MAKTFKTAVAFRMSLEQRLKVLAAARGTALNSLRLSGRRETGVDCHFCQASSVDREFWKAAVGEARFSGLEDFRPLTL